MILDVLGALFCTLALVALAWSGLTGAVPRRLSPWFLGFYSFGTTCWLALGLVQNRSSLVMISVIQTAAGLALLHAKWSQKLEVK